MHGHFLAAHDGDARLPGGRRHGRLHARAAPSTGSPRRRRTPGRGWPSRAGCTRCSCTTRAAARPCTTGSPSTATPTSTRRGRPARWSTSTTTGQVQLLTTPLTPAEFALGEVRFKKQFRRLAPEQEDDGGADRRVRRAAAPPSAATAIPFIHATDDDRHLIKVACSDAIVAPGRGPAPLLADAAVPVRRPRGAADRAAPLGLRGAAGRSTSRRPPPARPRWTTSPAPCPSWRPPAGRPRRGLGGGFGGGLAVGRRPAAGAARRGGQPPSASPTGPVYLDPADEPLCNDCGTCYQELPQFFEKTTVVIDGAGPRRSPG